MQPIWSHMWPNFSMVRLNKSEEIWGRTSATTREKKKKKKKNFRDSESLPVDQLLTHIRAHIVV